MAPDGKSLLMDSDKVIHQSHGSEANKLYKINGLYYHFFSEVHGEGRVCMMERAKTFDGPWEIKQLNHVNAGVDKEPNQGGLIQLPRRPVAVLHASGPGRLGRPRRLPSARHLDRRLAHHRQSRRGRHRQHGLAGEKAD